MKYTIACLLLAGLAFAADPPATNLTEYAPPEKAQTTTVRTIAVDRAGLAGYLGVHVASKDGRLIVSELQPGGPADKAGLKKGDAITHVAGRTVARADTFRELLQMHPPGETVKIGVVREGKPTELGAILTAVSKPMKLGVERVSFGAQVADAKGDDEGTPVERVTPDSPAAAAGIKTGDILLKVGELTLRRSTQLADALAERRPGDVLSLTVRRGTKDIETKVNLTADRGERPMGTGGRPGGGRPGGGGFTGGGAIPLWTKPVFRLAVIGIEFGDVKHNAKIPPKEWEEMLFSKGTYTKKNATGQDVKGSLYEYFMAQSNGAFRIEGRFFEWVAVSKKRNEYAQGSGTSNRGALANDAVAKLLETQKDALKEFDGVMVIYAGSNAGQNRGSVYYPHAAMMAGSSGRRPYLACFEGGDKMVTLRSFVREFAFMIGLPDLAARTENAGSEGVGAWCLLGGAADPNPQGLCAWAKEQLGWIKPAVIDPTVKQKLILAPISSGSTQCVKVLVKPDGSEYFLLENRTKTGADAALPGEGLLIWRVTNNRPLLEESHGIEGSAGPRSLPELIPYPSKANVSFTPTTTPSSKSVRGGGLPVHITEIRKLPDGRITFHVGYEYQ